MAAVETRREEKPRAVAIFSGSSTLRWPVCCKHDADCGIAPWTTPTVTGLMDRWIVRYSGGPLPVRARLICLPHAGGGAAVFRLWRAHLPADVEICAVVPPGRDHRVRERPITEMSPLVDALAEALWPLLDQPFAVFGHSLGAAVAYEIACRFEDAGRPPVHLFAAGRRAPQLHATAPPIASLDESALLCEVQRRYGPIPAAVLAEPELMAMFLPTLRADLQINEAYWAPARPLPCPVSAFGGSNDATTSTEDLDRWSECTQTTFERCLLPGGHFFIHDSRQQLLSNIDRALHDDRAVDGGAMSLTGRAEQRG